MFDGDYGLLFHGDFLDGVAMADDVESGGEGVGAVGDFNAVEVIDLDGFQIC